MVYFSSISLNRQNFASCPRKLFKDLSCTLTAFIILIPWGLFFLIFAPCHVFHICVTPCALVMSSSVVTRNAILMYSVPKLLGTDNLNGIYQRTSQILCLAEPCHPVRPHLVPFNSALCLSPGFCTCAFCSVAFVATEVGVDASLKPVWG